MDKSLTAKALCLALALLLPSGKGAAAEDQEEYVAAPSGNPFFLPLQLEYESKGAHMRHPFHKFRQVWDDTWKTWPKLRENHVRVTLDVLRATPKPYVNRLVEFDVTLNERCGFYRPYVAHFHPDTHYNFSAWSPDAEIWKKDQRMDVFPFLYIDNLSEKVARAVEAMPRFATVRLWGEPTIVNEGQPWIEVHDAEMLKGPHYNEGELRQLEVAYGRMEKRDWGVAETTFEALSAEQLPMQTMKKVLEALGQCRMEQQKYASAREALIDGLKLYGTNRVLLTEALLKDNRCVSSLVLLAECDLNLERNDEAKTAAELAVKLDASSPLGHVLLGMALAKLGDARAGLAEVDAGQRLAPDGRLLEACRYRARIYAMQGQWEAAKAELEKGLLLRANDAALHMELGDVLMALRNFAAAQKEYEFGTTLAPDRPEPYLKLAGAYRALGEAAVAQNKRDEAGAFFAQAIETIKKCYQKDDRYAPAYGFHAELLRALGKNAEAAAILAQGAKTGSTTYGMQEVLYEQARAQGDWDGMEQAAMKAIALRPQEAALHARLGDVRTYRPTPDYAGAEGEYAAAAELDPKNLNAWARLAFVRNKLGRYELAAQAASEATALDHNYYAWAELAMARRQLGDTERAIEAAENAIGIQKTAAGRALLAALYLDRGASGDAALALPLAKQAAAEAETPADRGMTQSVLGVALMENGELEAARASFMVSDFPMGQDAWHNLWSGRCMARLGDAADAVTRFMRASEASAPNASKFMKRLHEEAVKELKAVEQLPAAKKSAEAPSVNRPPVIETETTPQAVPVTAEPTPEK